MNESSSSLTGVHTADERLHQIVEEYARRLRQGERITPEEFAAEYPQFDEPLRALLRAASIMMAFGQESAQNASGMTTIPSSISGLLGDFRIDREIGRGGMGVVYQAEQVSLRRRVAVKVLPLLGMLDQQRLRRFKNEAHAAAVLQHPHIVSAFYFGCERGIHFYAMPFIDGLSLLEVVEHARRESGLAGDIEHRADPQATTEPLAALETVLSSPGTKRARRVAELGVQVARALEHAHREGVIHRDIKPSNLLVDRDGKLWITDFGLARVHDQGDMTLSGSVIGTLRYMSPEQLTDDQLVDQRTDIYSLGATLYELLALRPAFPESRRERLTRQVQEQEPVPLRRIDAFIPMDLETIVARAMTKERELRYQSAKDLADDLQRFLEQRPIVARPLGRIGRTWRWYRRSPAVAGLLTAVVLLSLMVGATGVLFGYRESEHRRQSDAAAEEARWQQYISDMHSAMAAYEQSNVGRALALLERHRPGPGEPDLRGFEWNHLWRRCHDDRLQLTVKETENLWSSAWSHDGGTIATGGESGLARLWDSQTGHLIHEFDGNQGCVGKVAFSLDDRILAAADVDGDICLWDLGSRALLRILKGPRLQVTGVVFSSDGTQLASGQLDNAIRIWDVATGGEVLSIHPENALDHPTKFTPIQFCGNGRLWVTGSDGTVRIFECGSGAELKKVWREELLYANQGTAALSSDQKIVATAARDGVIRLLDTETMSEFSSFGGRRAAIRSLTFAPGDRLLASSDSQGKVVVWNLEERKPYAVLEGHSGPVQGVAFSNDAQRLLTRGGDNTVKLWNLSAKPAANDVCQGHWCFPTCVAFSPDGRQMASGGADNVGGRVLLWNVATGRLEDIFERHSNWVWSVAFSPDGSEIASTGMDGTLRVWDRKSRSERMTIRTESENLQWVDYSRDGRQLICSGNQWLWFWDRDSGTAIRTVKLDDSHGSSRPALSPDGQHIAIGVNSDIVLLNYTSLELVSRFPCSTRAVQQVAFSRDGRTLACSDGSSVYLFSLNGKSLGTIISQFDIQSMDFSPDGRTLATGDSANQVHLWDIEHHSERATLHGHDHWVLAVRFSPDGKTLASASNDGTMRLWRSEPMR
jgi:WD40 repeat protein/serine/threonine protein kinase